MRPINYAYAAAQQEGKNGVSRHATIITQILFFLCIWPNSLKRYPFTGIQKKVCGEKKKKNEKKNDQKMKEVYTSEMYRWKLRLIRAMMTMMGDDDDESGTLGTGCLVEIEGPRFPIVFSSRSFRTGPLRFPSWPIETCRGKNAACEPFFILNQWGGEGDTLLVRSLCLFLPLNDRNSFFTDRER